MSKVVFIVFMMTVLTGAGEARLYAADINIGGEFRSRAFYTQNLSDAHGHRDNSVCPGGDLSSGTIDDTNCDDQEAFADIRVRMKVTASQGMATGVVLVDFFNDHRGQDAATLNTGATGSGTGDHVLGGSGFGRSLDTVSLREAYLRVSWPAMHFIAGRYGFKLGNGLILDDTADAVTIAIPATWATFTFSQLLLDTNSRGSGNTTLYLSNLSMAPYTKFKTGLFGFFLNDRGPNLVMNPCVPGSTVGCPITVFGDDQMVLTGLGWTMDFKGKTFHWATELDYLKGTIRTKNPAPRNPSGDDISLRGINALAQLGWTGRAMDAELTGIYGSGQDPEDYPGTGDRININAISPNFVLGNILVNNETTSDRDGGDIGGLSAGKMAIGWRPDPMVRLEAVGIVAWLSEKPLTGESRYLGWEVDGNLSWEIERDLRLEAGLGFLFTGGGWKNLLNDPGAGGTIVKGSTKLVYSF